MDGLNLEHSAVLASLCIMTAPKGVISTRTFAKGELVLVPMTTQFAMRKAGDLTTPSSIDSGITITDGHDDLKQRKQRKVRSL